MYTKMYTDVLFTLVFPMASLTNRWLCKSTFHAAQHDVYDDVAEVKLYDDLVKKAPTTANRNTYATTCVSKKTHKKWYTFTLNRLTKTSKKKTTFKNVQHKICYFINAPDLWTPRISNKEINKH